MKTITTIQELAEIAIEKNDYNANSYIARLPFGVHLNNVQKLLNLIKNENRVSNANKVLEELEKEEMKKEK